MSLTAAVLLPVYWLLRQPGLLMIYCLSLAVLFWSIFRTECGRCIFYECPANRVPEHIKEASVYMGD